MNLVCIPAVEAISNQMNIRVIGWSDSLWLETLEKLRHDIYHLPEYLYLESVRYNAVAEAILGIA